jgi:uncharacterized protein (TIGR03086 family)
MRFVSALPAALRVQVDVMSQVCADDLGRPSACAGWTIRQALNHSLGVTRKFTEFASGDTDTPRTPAGDLVGEDPCAAVRDSAIRSARAWMHTDLERVCVLPFAQVDADVAAGINLYDVVAHTWDIAMPLGLDLPCDVALWAVALQAAETALNITRDPQHFGQPVAVDTDAPPQVRFLALLGRSSR